MPGVPSSFWQWLSSLPQHEQSFTFLTFALMVAVTLFLIAAIVSFTVYKIHRNRLNDSLKRELLERGMSSEDIVEIVRATPTRYGAADRLG